MQLPEIPERFSKHGTLTHARKQSKTGRSSAFTQGVTKSKFGGSHLSPPKGFEPFEPEEEMKLIS